MSEHDQDYASFIAQQSKDEAKRLAAGLPCAKLASVEDTVFFRFLTEQQQAEIKLATTDRGKRDLLEWHILGG